MKKIALPFAATALVVLLAWGVSGSMPEDAEALTAKPNIVFILADDMRKDDLKYMPKTRNLLKAKGMSFNNAFVSHALCCPARATIMRGQYAHNTGVWTSANSRIGGVQAYNNNGLHRDNVATRLDAAGYRTGLIGKYLNDYRNTRGSRGDGTAGSPTLTTSVTTTTRSTTTAPPGTTARVPPTSKRT
jgi:arylsulfatase A-like enzyme